MGGNTGSSSAGGDPGPPARPAPTLALLFRDHFVVGATGFGGSIVWLRRVLVERRGWLTAEEFNEALGVGQFLPGPNVFNVMVVAAPRLRGVAGVVVSTVAIMGAPFLFALVLGALYVRFGRLPAVQSAIHGIAPVAAGLMLTLGLKVAASPGLRNALAGVGLLTFIAVGFLRLSLPVVLATMVPLGILVAAWQRR